MGTVSGKSVGWEKMSVHAGRKLGFHLECEGYALILNSKFRVETIENIWLPLLLCKEDYRAIFQV